MRWYIEEPERFEREITSVQNFNAESSKGHEPSYGSQSAAYLLEIVRELGI